MTSGANKRDGEGRRSVETAMHFMRFSLAGGRFFATGCAKFGTNAHCYSLEIAAGVEGE
jgi:hypothetical protein